jgi:uncharacterized protein YjdB
VKDGSGNTLTGRTVTWSSDHGEIATVSSSGVVTAVAIGTATITATSESKTGTAQITVAEGTVVGSSGGTVTVGDGTIQLDIPAGALTTPTPITATPLSQPRQAPPTQWQNIGPMYALSPSGTTFAQPVTVTLKYDPAKLPTWIMTGDLAILHLSGNDWSTLTDVTVDTAAKTISGKTTSFSDVGTGAEDPQVALTPSTGSVNATHRSVIFHVALTPRGQGVSVPSTAPPVMYRWKTSGQNGVISGTSPDQWTTTDEVQYTATNAVLDQLSGKIDDVTVDILLNPASLADPAAGPQRIVTAQASIDADLDLTFDISPDDPTIGPGATANLQLVVANKQGQTITLPGGYKIDWQTSGNFGTLAASGSTPQLTATYTGQSTFNSPPPRVDDITVKITQDVQKMVRVFKGGAFGFTSSDEEMREYSLEKGSAKGFVEVKVDYKAKLTPANDTLPIGGSINLTVTVDPTYDGPGFKYRYSHTGNRGSIDLAENTLLDDKKVKFTANSDGSGSGSDKVKVEVVSVVAGVELQVVTSAEATLSIDDWLSGSFAVAESPTPGGEFISAQISIPKVTGATQYQVEVINNDATVFTKTFSGATSTNLYSIGEVLDGGGSWKINLEGGFATTAGGITGRKKVYTDNYVHVKVRYKVQH